MTASMIRVAVSGAAGRMGLRVCALLSERSDATLAAAIDRAPIASLPTLHRDTPIDAIIDFSSPEGAIAAAELAVERGAALLVCTTGLGPDATASMEQASRHVPVMLAPNTSLGVAVVRRLVAAAATMLGQAFEIEIVEAHHARKKDAPSGTALSLASALSDAGRPVPAERIHALRGGDVVGEHEVWFCGPGETIRIAHQAINRDLFAAGAIRAACWLAGQSAGRYRIEDSLSPAPEARS
ncbi:MAG: 4-hydroxy-tetrahydrodipicolinate reductase [Phycisphaerales bacterium]|nr:4-hydroxy-tetrahydrodipicolinate reductase [Phycisphaerales bacterium]